MQYIPIFRIYQGAMTYAPAIGKGHLTVSSRSIDAMPSMMLKT